VSERAAIVTGASSGIGFAIAEMLGREGYGLTINSRRPERIEEAGARLRDAGFEVEVVAGSVAAEEVVQGVVARHRERFGRLDVLVNNAGVLEDALLGMIQPQRTFDINAIGVLNTMQACARPPPRSSPGGAS
jgi:NAD(P)-dependent dehydrogenase (short-subunit alcohol dehydrogenase family)